MHALTIRRVLALAFCAAIYALPNYAKAQPPPPAAAAAPVGPDATAMKIISDNIDEQAKVADSAGKRALTQKGKTLDADRAAAIQVEVDAATAMLQTARGRFETLQKRTATTDEEKSALAKDTDALKGDVTQIQHALEGISKELTDVERVNGWSLVETLLEARCATAICFSNNNVKNWLGIEPLVELPFGKSFAVGSTTLSDWVNNHDLRVDLAAGVRVWGFRDVVSLSVYLSKPLNDTPVRLSGGSFVYPGASIRRPYPGVALGLLFDAIWIGFDRDELRNGDGQTASGSGDTPTGAVNSKYPPNEAISSSWTVTIALQPVTAFRTAIGTAVQSTKGKK